MRQVVLIIVCAMAAQLCHSENLRVSPFPVSFQFYRYKDGHIVDRKPVSHGDRVYDALLSFLSNHSTNWTPDLNTYGPLLFFRSRDLTVNSKDDVVVVNYKDKRAGRWRQLSNSVARCAKAMSG